MAIKLANANIFVCNTQNHQKEEFYFRGIYVFRLILGYSSIYRCMVTMAMEPHACCTKSNEIAVSSFCGCQLSLYIIIHIYMYIYIYHYNIIIMLSIDNSDTCKIIKQKENFQYHIPQW